MAHPMSAPVGCFLPVLGGLGLLALAHFLAHWEQ